MNRLRTAAGGSLCMYLRAQVAHRREGVVGEDGVAADRRLLVLADEQQRLLKAFARAAGEGSLYMYLLVLAARLAAGVHHRRRAGGAPRVEAVPVLHRALHGVNVHGPRVPRQRPRLGHGLSSGG